MPETAGGEFVMDRFRGLVSRVVGSASIAREAKHVLIECGGQIVKLVDEAERTKRVQGRHRDLQQQSDCGKHPTETARGSAGLSAPRSGDNSLPKQVANSGAQQG